MPQMMPIWWSIMLIMSLMFIQSMSSVLYFFPLYDLSSKVSTMSLGVKMICLSKYDL